MVHLEGTFLILQTCPTVLRSGTVPDNNMEAILARDSCTGLGTRPVSKHTVLFLFLLNLLRKLTLFVTATLSMKLRTAITTHLQHGSAHAKKLRHFCCRYENEAADRKIKHWPELTSALASFPALSVLEFMGSRWWVDGNIVTAPKQLLELHYLRTHQYEKPLPPG